MDHQGDMNTMGNWTDLYKKIKRAEDNLKLMEGNFGLKFRRTWDSMATARERRSKFKVIQGGKSNGKKG